MNSSIKKLLEDRGYTYNNKAQNIIKTCDDWYSAEPTAFHSRTNVNGIVYNIKTLGMAKRGCADDANLCEIVEINGGENEKQFEGINAILKRNRFDVMFRKQLEQMSASGTVGCYLRIDDAMEKDGQIVSGKVALNYCNADNIVPLTVVNNDIIECAFVGDNLVRGTKEEVLVLFTLDEGGKYLAESHYFVDGKEQMGRATVVQLGEVRPFAIMRTAEVNSFKDMEGYGYPKVWSVIPTLELLDLCFNILHGDLDKGEKLVFINELLSCIRKGADGTATLTKKQQEMFVLLGEKLPTQSDIIHEYNPEIRVEEITKTFELLLSLFSMSFGYGTKKYTFEGGQIKSATEYIGEKQDAMQELNKQRKEATDYITGIVNAIIWFSNQFEKTAWVEGEVLVEFDDSYITNKEEELQRLREDALVFDIPTLTVWYLMKAYNLTEDEAKELVIKSKTASDQEDIEDASLGEDE